MYQLLFILFLPTLLLQQRFNVLNAHIGGSGSTTTTRTGSTSGSDYSQCDCRSNITHIAWRRTRTITKDSNNNNNNDNNEPIYYCTYETIQDAKIHAYQYLLTNIRQFDIPFRTTLGFNENDFDNDDNNDDNILPDGLGNGLIGPTINLAFQTKILFDYTDTLSQDIFYQYVLNYNNLNEGRTNFRPYFWNKLIIPLLLSSSSNSNSKISNTFLSEYSNTFDDGTNLSLLTNNQEILQQVQKNLQNEWNISTVVKLLNEQMWTILSPNISQPIYFKSSQAPAILDSMSTLIYGYGSCSAVSILFVNALRTAGVPCRVVGTPAWYGNRSQGNHNWIEVYYNNTWYFLESQPAALYVDTIETNPCRRWFCTPDRFPNNNRNSNSESSTTTTPTTTQVYAAKLDSSTTTTFFRLAWEWYNQDIPADDVTSYYQTICSQCGAVHDDDADATSDT